MHIMPHPVYAHLLYLPPNAGPRWLCHDAPAGITPVRNFREGHTASSTFLVAAELGTALAWKNPPYQAALFVLTSRNTASTRPSEVMPIRTNLIAYQGPLSSRQAQ